MIPFPLQIPEESIQDFCRKWNITEMSVFGSILRKDFNPESDIDFVVRFEEGIAWSLFDHMSMKEELAKICGRPVDLITMQSIEDSLNWIRKKEILDTMEQIYAA
jgi:hypothetical protein